MNDVPDDRYVPIRRTIIRGLANWLQLRREQLAPIIKLVHGAAEAERELKLIDQWLKELRTAQQRIAK